MKPEFCFLQSDAQIPNNPDLPVLIYRDAGAGEDLSGFFSRRFRENEWGGIWTDGIFDYHHFHPNAHEALAVLAGEAKVRLGGESGADFTLSKGDLVILPAGTGHKRLSASDDFSVMGAYPSGQEDYDICKSRSDCEDCEKRIAAVQLPAADPLTGRNQGLCLKWIKK